MLSKQKLELLSLQLGFQGQRGVWSCHRTTLGQKAPKVKYQCLKNHQYANCKEEFEWLWPRAALTHQMRELPLTSWASSITKGTPSTRRPK